MADPVGLAQTAGLSGVNGGYYFVGVPLGSDGINLLFLFSFLLFRN